MQLLQRIGTSMRKFLALAIIPFAVLLLIGIAAQEPYPGLVRIEASDPTVGPGFAGATNEMLYRTDAPSLYYKSGPASTAWTLIGQPASAVSAVVGANWPAFLAIGTPNDLDFDGTTTIEGIAPAAGPAPFTHNYQLTRDIVGRNITIDANILVASRNWRLLATGILTVNGVARCNGGDANGQSGGLNVPGNGYVQNPSGGGTGATGSIGGTNGFSVPDVPFPVWQADSSANGGPINGPGTTSSAFGRGGGGGGSPTNTGGAGGTMANGTGIGAGSPDFFAFVMGSTGNLAAAKFSGASGGGGGGAQTVGGSSGLGGGGGAGAGWLFVVAHEISGSGSLLVNGGKGAGGATSPVTAPGGGGGGGGGGVLVLVYYHDDGTVTEQASGGLGGSGANGGFDGADGSPGTVMKINTSGDGS